MVAFYPSGGRFPDFVLIRGPGWQHSGSPRAPGTVFFSGLAVIGQELVSTPDRFDAHVSSRTTRKVEAKSFAGCYSAVIRRRGYIAIVNDLFGLCPIYYYNDDNYTIVSNRSHLIALTMLNCGIRRLPNLEVIYTLLASHHWFFEHPYSHETLLSGLRICPADSVLVLNDRHGLTRLKKIEYSPAGAEHGSSHSHYPTLITQAAEDIKRNVAAVINSREFRHPIVDITGGKDSRLTFAAVASAGLLSRCVTRTTEHLPGDLEIGVAIAELYGARFDKGYDDNRYSKSARFAIGYWRSMHAGMHHRVGASNWLTLQGTGAVRLNGGCGEIYRDYWASHRLLSDIATPERFDRLCRGGLPALWRGAAFQSLWQAIGSLPGATAAEKLRNHYLFFRNRFHFGTPAYNEWYGYVPFSPLQSPALLSASNLLDPANLIYARAAHDVTERLLPRLNDISFGDGTAWPREFARERRGRAAPLRLPPFAGELRRKHEAAEATRKRLLAANSRKVDVLARSESVHVVLLRDAAAALAIMREADSALARILDDQFAGWLSKLSAESPKQAAAVASKLLAIYDLCFDTRTLALDLPGLPLGETYSRSGFSAVTGIYVGRLA
jgi:hypothetical protein